MTELKVKIIKGPREGKWGMTIGIIPGTTQDTPKIAVLLQEGVFCWEDFENLLDAHSLSKETDD